MSSSTEVALYKPMGSWWAFPVSTEVATCLKRLFKTMAQCYNISA